MRRFVVPLAWLVMLFVASTKLVEWTTQFWWFDSLGQGATFGRLMAWRAGSFLVGAALFSLIFAQNLRLSLVLLRSNASESAFFERPANRLANAAFGPLRDIVTICVAFAALFAGAAAANRFDLWVALFGAFHIGEIEKFSGQDLGFFLFTLPALWWIWNFFGVALMLSFFACGTLYFWGELIETGPRTLRVTRRASAHLALLAACLVLWQGVRQGILAISAPIAPGWTPIGVFGPAEANYEVPVRYFLLFSSLPLAFLLFRIFTFPRDFDRGTPTTSARSSLAFGALVWMGLCLVLPTLAAPLGRALLNDQTAQTVAIARHLGNARRAWNLENAAPRELNLPAANWREPRETSAAPPENAIAGIGLWALPALQLALERLDSNPNTTIGEVSVFARGGELFYRAVSQNRGAKTAQSAQILEVPAGATSAKSARKFGVSSLLITETGGPLARLSPRALLNAPSFPAVASPNGAPSTSGPNAQPPDFPEERAVTTTFAPIAPLYRATDSIQSGVSREGFWRCALLAWRFFDRDLLEPGEPISWHVTPRERAAQLLPFLDWSQSTPRPLPVFSGENARLSWAVAGYVKSRTHPDSPALQVNSNWQGINYLRHAVTLVIDGATGATRALPLDADEPHLKLWRRAFPEAFDTPLEKTSENARLHASGVELFEAQSQILTRYFSSQGDLEAFAKRTDLRRVWSVNAIAPLQSPMANTETAPSWIWTFAPSQGSAASAEARTELVGFFTSSSAPSGPIWRGFAPKTPLELPDVSEAPIARLNSLESAPFFALGFNPPLSPKNPQTPREIQFFRARFSQTDLQIDWRTLFSLRSSPDPAPAWSEATRLWDTWKAARKRGAWGEVQELEAQLDKILNSPKLE